MTEIIPALDFIARLTQHIPERHFKIPPEGMTSGEVCDMSNDDLLDMDYFLLEFDDLEDDDFGKEGFYTFKSLIICLLRPASAGLLIYMIRV